MGLINDAIASAIRELATHARPYMEDLVIVGGCASALYRHHELAALLPGEAIGTQDVDVACLPPIPPRGESPLFRTLESAGFSAEIHAELGPIKFVSASGVEIEFLAPLTGAAHSRRGSPKQAIEVQSRVSAQQLRYLDLLLFEPWRVISTAVPELAALQTPVNLQVPNPAMYVAQKVLIRDQGRLQKSAPRTATTSTKSRPCGSRRGGPSSHRLRCRTPRHVDAGRTHGAPDRRGLDPAAGLTS
jgi:hypothetical protein